jgi:hypothetical protein
MSVCGSTASRSTDGNRAKEPPSHPSIPRRERARERFDSGPRTQLQSRMTNCVDSFVPHSMTELMRIFDSRCGCPDRREGGTHALFS